MKKIARLFFLCVPVIANAQVTFTEQIAPIIYNKCASCHHKGDIGPMPLTNYEEVKKASKMVQYVTGKKIMPPWMPDTSYSHFLNERTITEHEINLIKDWISGGMMEGKKGAEPELPSFPQGSQLGKPDLTVSMKESYMHKGNNQDEYRVFVLPTKLTEGHNISAIEIRPGNPKIAHHIILGCDTTHRADKLDAKDPVYGYEQYAGFGFYPTYDNWAGWIPGNKARFFPANISNYVLPNSDVLLQMHYGPSSIDATDSTSVNLFFNKNPTNRYIKTHVIGPNEIVDGPFYIPAGKVKTFHAKFKVMTNVSLISITPHMHWLGKSCLVYAINPAGDTTKIIRINDWDFNWQNFFSFKNLIKIEKGSTIYVTGTFDNTLDNPNNPNNPPKNITWGESAKDEMFLFYAAHVPYEQGDENIAIAGNGHDDVNPVIAKAESKINVEINLIDNSLINLKLVDEKGKLVKEFLKSQTFNFGKHKKDFDIAGLKPGNYWLKMSTAFSTVSKGILIN